MASKSRIYSVTTDKEAARLVRAQTAAQAVRHVWNSMTTCDVASQDDLVTLIASGVKVEDAGEELAPSQSG